MDITQLLNFAVDNGAEGALISAGSPPILRKGGRLVFTKMAPMSPTDTRETLFAALAPEQVDTLLVERALTLSIQVREDRQCLASIYFERGTLSAVFRIAPPSPAVPAKLGLPSLVTEAVRAECGLVVIASPPGHGKSSALNALVELINTEREATVITIEERVVYPHVDKKCVVHQREVGRDTQSCVSALESAPDMDPDVLVVDPMDGPEAVRRVLDFTGRGRLVLASMRADYVLEALGMLLSAASGPGAEAVRRQLASSLTFVAAMRLLPRADGDGRVAATEVLKVDARVSRLVRNADLAALETLMNDPDETGTWTMDSFILKLHERGLIDAEAARRFLLNADLLET